MDTIIEHIKTTEAYDNSFFRHCKEWKVTRDQLSKLAVNWELVTKSFWQSSCALVGDLAIAYREHTDLLLAILKIAAEHGGLGGGAVDGKLGSPHYQLYRQMWEYHDCDWGRALESETKRLVSGFVFGCECRISTAPYAGALAEVVVMETIASNIVDAMWQAHVSAGFNPENVGYLTLHKTLEIEHADAMGAVIEHVKATGLDLWSHVRPSCERWARFWKAMDRIVFGV